VTTRPRIAITTGEPAGIGPDLCCALPPLKNAELILIGDESLLRDRAEQLNQSIADSTQILNIDVAEPVVAGDLNTANARYVLKTIDEAVTGCRQGRYDAMVTAPVHKGVINDAGVAFSGHTEYIAEQLHADPVMVLAADDLRVALVTTHLPLADVATAITRPLIEKTLNILHADLVSKYRIAHPHILVCGLNPHAGESGHLGREEIDTIIPAIDAAQSQGINVTGPYPADTLFTPRHLDGADAVLAMYHDQGLPVLKYAGFGKAVNITFGLPIIRTSVDHGTALDLAATGEADNGSLLAAIELATALAGAALAES
jgi:4-hydroxythreonine-4-phosphate dehydrogenase